MTVLPNVYRHTSDLFNFDLPLLVSDGHASKPQRAMRFSSKSTVPVYIGIENKGVKKVRRILVGRDSPI